MIIVMLSKAVLLASILLLAVPALVCGGASWVRVLGRHTVLESDLRVSYSIDAYDPARFHDLHALLHAGSALLYTTRVPAGEGSLSIPCGVITHAGTHSLTISYTNTTVIATTQFGVAWPVIAVTVPHRMETYTMDVVIMVSFTKNLCTPLLTSGKKNNPMGLQNVQRGILTVWLKVEKCETKACDKSKVVYKDRLENFYTSHSSKVTIKCSEWGVSGIFRVIIVAVIDPARHVDDADSVIARSRVFTVEYSSEYDLQVDRVAVEPCHEGDTMVVEMDYPACILNQDKIRLHQETAGYGLGRRIYLGEQRVIPGDKAVIFPCSAFSETSSGDQFCFSYVSTARDGAVATLKTVCLPRREHGPGGGGWTGWAEWSSWSSCSTSCGQGVATRYRFCGDTYRGANECKGPRVASRQCLTAKCIGTTSALTSPSLDPSPSPPPRPTPVYGASPCACGCTYILHSSSEDGKDNPSRDINIVSGICPGLPISWTVKVPPKHEMHLTLSNVSFSCPSLHLNLRDGMEPTDTILYQAMATTNNSVRVQTSKNIIRLELDEDRPGTDLSSCYAVLYFTVRHGVSSHVHSQEAFFIKSDMKKVLELSTPILLVISLTIIMVICTFIMLVDYQIKKVKYTRWKARPTSGYSSPTEGCKSYDLIEDIHTSLSTISDYIPLVEENIYKQRTKAEILQSKSLPATPAHSGRRQLLRRSETMREKKLRVKKKRKFSLPPKVYKSKLYMSVDTVDGDDEREDNIKESSDKLSDIKPLKMNKVMARKMKKRPAASSSTTASSSITAPDSSSSTLKQARSVSEFSCLSQDQELEYDLYDCHIDNAMAVPGSLFAPAYWDTDLLTPQEELELEQLFSDAMVKASEETTEDDEVSRISDKQEMKSSSNSPVMLRSGQTARKPLITSMTSDLTASISSAISDSTLVGDMMDTSCYYSGEEETNSIMSKKEKMNIMNITHMEDIEFVDQ